ncbi:gustatory receptor 109 [Tribolium castaneum]|uniref:Gustatory receptor n=1 Tax=Tribolium castaneum TaxID=7070 RepID=D6WRP6_TRICA|nr:gustatory receptor 109 [Tribolium castaneum]
MFVVNNMVFHLSIKDINFIRPLWSFLNLLQITPYYDFDKNVTIRPLLSKIHGMILIVIKTVWIVTMIKDEDVFQMWKTFSFTQKFTFTLVIINTVALNILTIVKSSLLKAHSWKRMIKNFQQIDVKLRNRGRVETSVWGNFYFKYTLKQILFLIFCAYELYSWSNFIAKIALSSIWFSPMGDLFYEFQTFNLITCLLQSIKVRYEVLNEKLVMITKRKAKSLYELQEMVQIYRILGETIEIYNSLFGYQILLITFHCGLQLVGCLNFPLVALNTSNFDINIILCNIIFLMIMLGCFIWMVLLMESTVQEAEKFVNFCYKLQEQVFQDSREIDVLRTVTAYAQHFTRKFSAGGFFYIGKKIIFSLIGHAATYLIIAVQFNERQFQK